jgi:3-oxoacyl-[acyl-carrier protein] reductase
MPGMIQKNCGNIINNSSIWGMSGSSCESLILRPKPHSSVLAKHGRRVLALVIRVNCISPGVIDTPMNANIPTRTANSRRNPPNIAWGKPRGCQLVRFLASRRRLHNLSSISPNGVLIQYVIPTP